MQTSARRRRWLNLCLLAFSTFLAVALMEFVLRRRYEDRVFYKPRPEVLFIQAHLERDPTLGFTWRKNVRSQEDVVIRNSDVEPIVLTTDECGFWNPPDAIDNRLAAKVVDVVGLGDSFIEHAAFAFVEKFREKGLSYYNQAIHRQCPLQYNQILNRYVLPLSPRYVIYGVFENDFSECQDFQEWRASGKDWFRYHGGFWCGPPLGLSPIEQIAKTYFRGFYSFERIMTARVRGEKMSVMGPTAKQVQTVESAIAEAARLSADSGARFILLLIPSRYTVTQGTTLEAKAFDEITASAQQRKIETLDLRPLFASTPDASTLYYKQDAHWNRKGIELCADAILDVIAKNTVQN